MGVPATTGKRCTNLADMEIGDYIACKYYAPSANVAGVFSDLGGSGTELPVTPGTTANGYFYFLKVAKGLCVADRMVQSSLSAKAVNTKIDSMVNSKMVKIRLLSKEEFVHYIGISSLSGTVAPANRNVFHAELNSKNLDVPIKFDWNESTAYMANDNKFYLELIENRSSANMFTAYRRDGKTQTYDSVVYHTYSILASGNWQLYFFIKNTNEYNEVTFETTFTRDKTAVICFRPALEFVDNQKSTNIWY